MSRKSALKGRSSLLRPFRADVGTCLGPRACALGFPAGPLRGPILIPYLSAIRDGHQCAAKFLISMNDAAVARALWLDWSAGAPGVWISGES